MTIGKDEPFCISYPGKFLTLHTCNPEYIFLIYTVWNAIHARILHNRGVTNYIYSKRQFNRNQIQVVYNGDSDIYMLYSVTKRDFAAYN